MLFAPIGHILSNWYLNIDEWIKKTLRYKNGLNEYCWSHKSFISLLLKTLVSLVQLSTLLHKVKTWGLHPRSLLPMQNRTEKAFIALCKALIMAVPFHFTQKTKVIESQIWLQTYSILRFNIRVKLSKQIFRNMICDFNVPFERRFVAYIITYMDINRIYYWTQLRKETFKQFLFACFCFIKIFIKLIHVPKIITLNVTYQKMQSYEVSCYILDYVYLFHWNYIICTLWVNVYI